MLAASVSTGLVACSGMMGQCFCEDIAAMFGHFHDQKAELGLRVLRLNKEKGWLVPPSLHNASANE